MKSSISFLVVNVMISWINRHFMNWPFAMQNGFLCTNRKFAPLRGILWSAFASKRTYLSKSNFKWTEDEIFVRCDESPGFGSRIELFWKTEFERRITRQVIDLLVFKNAIVSQKIDLFRSWEQTSYGAKLFWTTQICKEFTSWTFAYFCSFTDPVYAYRSLQGLVLYRANVQGSSKIHVIILVRYTLQYIVTLTKFSKIGFQSQIP